MGGSRDTAVLTDHNLITLCRSCHSNLHEGGWQLERASNLLRVVDRRIGQEAMRRRYAPEFDASSFLQALSTIDRSLTEALTVIAYLDDEQLVEAFRASRALGKRSWLIQAAILHEAQRRSVYGDRSLGAIARRFEISLNMAEKYARVWAEFFGREDGEEIFNVEDFFLDEPSWYIVAATESPEPRQWLAYAQDRKAENPRYSIRDFRLEIQRAVGATAIEIERTAGDGNEADRRILSDCPWVKPYCTRSGRPLPARECACEVASLRSHMEGQPA